MAIKIYNERSELILDVRKPRLKLRELQDSFNFVPYDDYFKGSRYRTTSRIQVTDTGEYELLEKRPLYQPGYVNNIDSYGGIDRIYDNIPISLLSSVAFRSMINAWFESIPYKVRVFSVHQIRTTHRGCPTPEGSHKDGTDWTGVFIVNRHNVVASSALTQYWDNEGKLLLNEPMPMGTLLSHCDSYFVHGTTNIEPEITDEPSYRDVFVLTSPEHGVNLEQATARMGGLAKDSIYALDMTVV